MDGGNVIVMLGFALAAFATLWAIRTILMD